MALLDLTFKFYTDAGLTILAGPIKQLTHSTDLSDNPQDFVLYFGSNATATKLEAVSNPGVDPITFTPTDTLPNWAVATVYALGTTREPSTPNGFVYEVTTAGTSHATTEPTWPTTGIGSTVNDGTVTWTFRGPRHEPDELTLALSEGDLATNTPGAALDIGPTVLSGVAEAVPVWFRIENAVTTPRNTAGRAEYGIAINEVIETEV